VIILEILKISPVEMTAIINIKIRPELIENPKVNGPPVSFCHKPICIQPNGEWSYQ